MQQNINIGFSLSGSCKDNFYLYTSLHFLNPLTQICITFTIRLKSIGSNKIILK